MPFEPRRQSVLLLLALVASQATYAHRGVDELAALDVVLADASKPICVYVGQALRIHLPASPALGYEWVLEAGAPSMLRLENDPGGASASRLRTGASEQRWEFRAERSGHAALRFVLRRPWEARDMQTRSAYFVVVVRQAIR